MDENYRTKENKEKLEITTEHTEHTEHTELKRLRSELVDCVEEGEITIETANRILGR